MAQNAPSGRFETIEPNSCNPDQSADLALGQSTSDKGSSEGLLSERRHANNRRDGIWKAFLYGNFHPRRRISRRAADGHHFWFDWHEPRILYLALGILLLSCTDALFTLNLLREGATEGNWVMASMLEQSMDSFVVSKIGITSLSLLILVAAARRKFIRSFSVEHLLQVFLAGYILLICYEVYLFIYVFEPGIF